MRWSGRHTGQSWQEKNRENSVFFCSIFPPIYFHAVIKINIQKILKSLAVSEENMKLLTHNMLTSKCMKAVTTGYPLAIQARDVKVPVLKIEFGPLHADFGFIWPPPKSALITTYATNDRNGYFVTVSILHT